MATQSFRDVNTVSLLGSSITGVQSVRLGDESTTINYNSDAKSYRQDVGLTRQQCVTEIERVSQNKVRDVLSAVFTSQQGDVTGSVILGRVQMARINAEGSVINDSGDADSWVTYKGVTDINGQAEVEYRDLAQQRTTLLVKGKKGTFIVKAPIPRTGYGLPASTATETHKVTCVLTEIESTSPHGDLSSARLRFEAFASDGATDFWTASGATNLKPKSIGATGTASWVAPAADAGSPENVSVLGGVLVSQSVEFRHGETARATYRIEHKSADGSTTPVS